MKRVLWFLGQCVLKMVVISIVLVLCYFVLQSGLGAGYEENQQHLTRCQQYPWLTICGGQP